MVEGLGRGGTRIHPDRLAKRDAGQALVELALITPILVLLTMAIFQFAFVIETQIGLTNAVREAARRVATAPGPTEVWTQDQLDGSAGPPAVPGLLAENIQGFDPARLNLISVRFCPYDVGGTSNNQVEIEVRYNHPIFFPLLSFATDLVDGNPGDGDWTLVSATKMRLETELLPAPGPCPPAP